MRESDKDHRSQVDQHSKNQDLEPCRSDGAGTYLTSNQGVRINHTDDSLKAGERGPTLMEDFHLREKITHFDHEPIPERVVHARGAGAHGYFQVYESLERYTMARFLQEPSRKTPVFVRFSQVVGSKGSADTVRDVRGFATKFYTDEGNYDLVGNNIPVFFIQDAIKFPDLVHAIKPEPHHGMPQASAAHDTFWDFISLMPESMHMIMWVLSDRAIPRSYRMMEGFGVHTFRLVNQAGDGHFVKFHWKPALGTHALVWDEAQKIAGKDPDFLRRDLWDAIAAGMDPEWELGLQILPESQEFAFDFDLLDPTKIWPEEDVPVKRVGKLVLNRNPDNFFAETEQVAFHPGNVVPGIDFTNDPLLQGRLFSYLDTQLIRLGGPNFHQIPINRSLAPVHNNQRDGYHQHTLHTGRASYFPNSLGGGDPGPAPRDAGGYVHYTEKVEGRKIRGRSDSFRDFYNQARLFWNSLSSIEQQHMVSAAHFELGKVEGRAIQERMVAHFARIDSELATRVAAGLGLAKPADITPSSMTRKSEALSMLEPGEQVQSRKVAILVAEEVREADVKAVQSTLQQSGVVVNVVSKGLGGCPGEDNGTIPIDKTYSTTASVLFDAVIIPGGRHSEALQQNGDARHFIQEAFKHGKPLGAVGEGVSVFQACCLPGVSLASSPSVVSDHGVVSTASSQEIGPFLQAFHSAMAQHRHWERSEKDTVPA